MNDYFCVLPFFSYEIEQKNNNNTYCCRLTPGADIESVRQSMRSGIRASECSTCWKLEDAGLPSERKLHNSALDFYLDRDLELIEQDALEVGPETKIVKLATSNLCNGTCVTCGSHSSSAWASLESVPIHYRTVPQETVDAVDVSKIAQLSFLGGEPLLEKMNFRILEQLIETNNTKCFVSIVTNGSVLLSASQLSILKHFPNLNICISIDGVGPVFEYMRYPLSWQQLTESIAQFKSFAKHVSVSSMVSNLNIFYYDQMVDFFKGQDLQYLCKQIDRPSIFAPGNLPDSVKEQVLLLNPKYQDQLKGLLNCGTFSVDHFNKFKAEVVRQDNLKNISIQTFMPLAASHLKVE